MRKGTRATWFLHGRSDGLTLVETVVAAAVIVVGLLGLASVLVSVSHARQQSETRTTVLSACEALLEQIKGAQPDVVPLVYHGTTHPVPGLTDPDGGEDVLTVTVSETNPMLLVVRIDALWLIGTREESLSMTLEIYNPNG